jgi:hypothetical protein
MVTHNPQLARYAQEIVDLSDGQVVSRRAVIDRGIPLEADCAVLSSDVPDSLSPVVAAQAELKR